MFVCMYGMNIYLSVSSFLTQLIAGGNGWFSGETVLCVGHGASLKYCTK